MFLKKHWIFLTVLIVAICGVSLYLLHINTPKEPIKIYKPVEVEKPPAKAPVEDTPPQGHVHEDGTFHPEPHETPEPPKPPPGTVLKPDFPPVDPDEDPVEAAYKRLEYIKNNPYAWGGVHSERATELIAQLMPPPVLEDEGHGEQVDAIVSELIAQGDPRAAEVLITNICDGYIGGKMLTDALIEIGPPAVPYILPYLEEGMAQGKYIPLTVFRSLGGIGAEHRGDLGGIVEHILIPKLEVIAADDHDADFDEKYERFSASVMDAREALAKLGR